MKPITAIMTTPLFLFIPFQGPSVLATTTRVPADQPTIQAGIDASGGGDLVLVAPGTYVENIDFLGKAITVQSEAGAGLTVIDGSEAGTAVIFASGETDASVIDGFTLTNGSGASYSGETYGGGIFCRSASSPTIVNCTISGNSAEFGGGIACYEGSSPTITNCSIVVNTATIQDGGGVYGYEGSSPTITSCVISQNTAEQRGGGIAFEHWCSPVIELCAIIGNQTYWDGGGGVYLHMNDTPTMADITISENVAGHNGGGILCNDSPLSITRSTISGNQSGDNGGGLSFRRGDSGTVTDCLITENIASYGGGGMHFENTDLVAIDACTISGNSASNSGGGFYFTGSSPTLTSCAISGNRTTGSGSDGGGISCKDNSSPTFARCTISGNSAGSDGGGILAAMAAPILTNCLISGNNAGNEGGGFYCIFSSFSSSSPTFTHCTLAGNRAGDWGGGIWISESSSGTMVDCVSWGNMAPQGAEIAVLSHFTTFEVSYSDVQGGEAAVYVGEECTLDWLAGNIDADPLFVDPGHWDDLGTPGDPSDDLWVEGAYHIDAGSPCIDAGTDGGTYADIEGDTRPQRYGFDMGADEYTDSDEDGWASWEDCDEDDPLINPGVEEECESGIDEDCDGLIDEDDPDCLGEFTLDLEALFDGAILHLLFTMGTPEPCTWTLYFILVTPTVQVIPAWAITLPAIDPAIDVPIHLPFPSIGWIGGYTSLFTDDGVQASELVWVNTG